MEGERKGGRGSDIDGGREEGRGERRRVSQGMEGGIEETEGRVKRREEKTNST